MFIEILTLTYFQMEIILDGHKGKAIECYERKNQKSFSDS